MATSIDEKRKSITNSKNNLLDARVVGNYGDPGINEQLHFDLLSRFIIVMLESSYRVPNSNKWNLMFAVVKRPPSLWISTDGGASSSPNSQRRTDTLGNVSVGIVGNLTIAGIAPINFPYQLGEQIRIKKLDQPLTLAANDPFFNSDFSDSDFSAGSWSAQGSTLPYFAGNSTKIGYLQRKTIYRPDSNKLNQYGFTLNKFQYEAFFLNQVLGNDSLTNYATSLFANTISNSDAIYGIDGGYVFHDNLNINFLSVDYEDINVGGKERLSASSCLPTIVSVPASWPTPKARTLQTIDYTPSYSPIVTS